MAEEKYLYEIHPVRPVISPVEGRLTRRPFSCELSISQLGDIMGKARIFRRFPDLTELVPVTGATVHELHRPKFSDPIPEVALKEKERTDAVLVDVNKSNIPATPVTEVPKKEEPVVKQEEPEKVEEVIEKQDTVTEPVAEAIVEEGKSNEAIIEAEVQEVPVEESAENEQNIQETVGNDASEEVSVVEVEKEEKSTDLEIEASQDAEKEVSESKSAPTIVVPNQDNTNKFHDKKKDKKHNKNN